MSQLVLGGNALANPDVGSYLPAAGIGDLVLFSPDSQKTPAIRAGTIKPDAVYSFALPPAWRETRVANISSGNFCQPKCGEPWTEVIFENEKEGKLELMAAPLIKLTNKVNPTITDLGTPSELLVRFGPYITGTYLDEEDVVATSSKQLEDGRTYYYYELNAPYGKTGAHSVTACTTRGEVCYLFVVSANDKQWAKQEKTLRSVVNSFRA